MESARETPGRCRRKLLQPFHNHHFITVNADTPNQVLKTTCDKHGVKARELWDDFEAFHDRTVNGLFEHQEDGCQLFFDVPFSLLFLAYSALYCHFWPINFYNFMT